MTLKIADVGPLYHAHSKLQNEKTCYLATPTIHRTEIQSSNKATGLDNVSARLLKETPSEVIYYLTFIINLSITTGIFPNEWKYARVSPIFKDEDKTDPNNYRPISVLPIVSKLIERVVFNQLYTYLNYNNLLTESQSGFRPLFSTETTLLETTNEWI